MKDQLLKFLASLRQTQALFSSNQQHMIQGNQYVITDNKPKFTKLLVFAIAIALCFWAAGFLVVGILFTVLIGGMFFMPTGLILDRERLQIKRFSKFFGITVGSWQKLPPIEYISLLRVKQKRKAFRPSSMTIVQTSTANSRYQVNLIVRQGRLRPYKLLSTDLDDAIKKGLELGEFFDLRVYDATTSKQKWIR